MKTNLFLAILCLLLSSSMPSSAQTAPNLQFAGHLPMDTYGGFDGSYNIVCNDVEGYVAPNGIEYAIVGTHKGIAIVDVADAANPIERAFVQGGIGTTWRELAVYGHYAYCVTDGQEALGVLIIDLSNLPAGVTSQYWIPQIPNGAGGFYSLTKSHTISIEDGFMYLNGYNAINQETAFFDMHQNPTAPTYVGMVNDEYCHDSFVRSDTLYTSNIYTGKVRMYDIHDHANPVEIGVPFITPFSFTHQTWQSNNGNYMFTTDELPDAPIGAFNIDNVNNVDEVGRFLRFDSHGNGSVFHNLYVMPNDYLVIANYTEGVTIVDVRHPDNMVEIANYDTYPGATPSPPYSGVWATYPFLPSGKILVSDMASGFYTLTPTYARASWLQGSVTDGICGGVLNNVQLTIVNNATDVAGNTTSVAGVYKTGYKNAGTYNLRVEKQGYITQTVPVTLTQGQIVIKNIVLIPVGVSAVAASVTNTAMQPLASAKVSLENTQNTYNATTNAAGQAALSCVLYDTYDSWTGKWGYETKQTAAIAVNYSPFALPATSLLQGYADPFELDLGWTTSTTSINNTGFQREELTQFAGVAATDATDIGKKCYVTHSGGTTINNGEATLLSPPMDLSGFASATIRVNYRLYMPSGAGKIKYYLVTPTQTLLVDSSGTGPTTWRTKFISVGNFMPLSNNIQLKVVVSSPSVAATVEAAIDNLSVVVVIATEEIALENKAINAQPNPFHDICNLQLSNLDLQNNKNNKCTVYNNLGQAVQTVAIPSTGNVTIGENLPQGTYFVAIVSDNRIVSRAKIIKL